jgi:hypothetical protein
MMRSKQAEEKPLEHIILNGQRAFNHMTISRKPLLPGFASHRIMYTSTKTGYDVNLYNLKADDNNGRDSFESHWIDSSSSDEDPRKLYVTLDKDYIKLEDKESLEHGDIVYRINIIQLSEVQNILFDLLESTDGVTDIDNIIFRTRDDLKGMREE